MREKKTMKKNVEKVGNGKNNKEDKTEDRI